MLVGVHLVGTQRPQTTWRPACCTNPGASARSPPALDAADQAPLYHGQQSYSDATQYGACVLALDPLLLIRLALQQQIEYYFR